MKLSVIVPMGRPESAAPTLAALDRQRLKPPGWEVILAGVDAPRIAALFPGLPLRAEPLRTRANPACTRRAGVARAAGDWYLFVDDDVELREDFVENLLRIIRETPAIGAIGARLPGKDAGLFARLTDLSNFWSQQSGLPGDRPWLYSAALAVSAEAYAAAGGFEPDLDCGEDIRLTRAILRAGYRVVYDPDLVAFHDHRRDTLAAMLRYFWHNGAHARYLLREQPELRAFSLPRALQGAVANLRESYALNRGHVRGLGVFLPAIGLNYLLFQVSLEWHYQKALFAEGNRLNLSPNDRRQRHLVRAFELFPRPASGAGRVPLSARGAPLARDGLRGHRLRRHADAEPGTVHRAGDPERPSPGRGALRVDRPRRGLDRRNARDPRPLRRQSSDGFANRTAVRRTP